MDAPATIPMPRYIPWLPYWAVLQTDLRQTVRGWVWRTWVLASLLAALGYLLYRLGIYREAGIVQEASNVTGDLMRWPLMGTILLVVVLAVSAMTAERGTLADSVLSRGISRRQYFMAKLHSRLFSVLGTFLLMTSLVLTASHYLLHEDLEMNGCVIGLLSLGSLMALVVTCGVAAGALVEHDGVRRERRLARALCGRFRADPIAARLSDAGSVADEIAADSARRVRHAGVDAAHRLRMLASAVVMVLGMIGFSRSDV